MLAPYSARKNAYKLTMDALERAESVIINVEQIPSEQRTAEDILVLKSARRMIREATAALKALAPYAPPPQTTPSLADLLEASYD